jgi:GrpB-like predicted nucleotidyltransferase (UPF0157 family)
VGAIGSSDEDYDAWEATHVIGGPAIHDAPVRLADYDPEWPVLFEREAARIRGALGSVAVEVHHVGSTSVPGLAAKPVIDIVLGVPDVAEEAAYLQSLEAAGYVLRIREPEWFGHRLFKGPDTAINLHVFSVGCPEIAAMVRFRDRLRVDEGDRRLYEDTKRALAARPWRYVQQYADAKTDVVEAIKARAAGDASRF